VLIILSAVDAVSEEGYPYCFEFSVMCILFCVGKLNMDLGPIDVASIYYDRTGPLLKKAWGATHFTFPFLTSCLWAERVGAFL